MTQYCKTASESISLPSPRYRALLTTVIPEFLTAHSERTFASTHQHVFTVHMRVLVLLSAGGGLKQIMCSDLRKWVCSGWIYVN